MKRIALMILTTALFLTFSLNAFVTATPATNTLDIIVHKTTVKPTIDGKAGADEWGEAVMYQESGVGYTWFPDSVSPTFEHGVKATIYMLWDEDGFYIAAVAEDPTHFNQYSGMDIWNGDAFEFDSNFNPDDYTDRNRQCMGMNNDGEIYGGSYKVAEGVGWDTEDIQFTEYKIARDGNKTTYEAFVKWENFCPSGASFAKVGNIFRGNVQFHLAVDGDYLECQRYVIYDAATDTSTYPNFILSEAAVAQTNELAVSADTGGESPASPAEPVTVTVTAAPSTGDGFASILLMFVIFGAALTVFGFGKKIKIK